MPPHPSTSNPPLPSRSRCSENRDSGVADVEEVSADGSPKSSGGGLRRAALATKGNARWAQKRGVAVGYQHRAAYRRAGLNGEQ